MKALRGILINDEILYELNFNDFFKDFDLLSFIYSQSKIDIDLFYETCTMISMKTSNSQSEVYNMPYFVFNNYMIYYNRIIEKENTGNTGGGADASISKTMGEAKTMMKGMTSGFKKPKI